MQCTGKQFILRSLSCARTDTFPWILQYARQFVEEKEQLLDEPRIDWLQPGTVSIQVRGQR
jgi:hypothetical protein